MKPSDSVGGTSSTTSPKVLVVVGFAEALAAPEVVWSLVDSGCKVLAFARKGRHAALRHSRYVEIQEITAPENDSGAALTELASFLESRRDVTRDHHVLLPLDDVAVWLCSQIPVSSGWIVAGPRGSCAALALNKQLQIEAARAAGFNVPTTSIVSTAEELAAWPRHFPVILRPAEAVSVHGTKLRKGRNWICSDEAELQLAQASWNGVPLLVQPYLEGAGEGVFGLATENGIVAWSAHRRLRMMNPHGSGSSSCVSEAVPDEVKPPVAALIQSSGWRGMFMVELLRSQDGRLWFVEFNGRAWGSMALARRQSLEYPAWTVKLALDQTPPGNVPRATEGVVSRNVGRELMHVLFVLRGPRSRAIRTWPSLWSTLAGVFHFHRRGSFYNWRKDDWRVFVSDSWYTIRDQIMKGN
jgi:predicted ATP-grasp superfamily ATP-dependent carboligase